MGPMSHLKEVDRVALCADRMATVSELSDAINLKILSGLIMAAEGFPIDTR
jgi:hypothetical protein